MSEDRFGFPDFFILQVSGNWSTVENDRELSGYDRYWVCCGDRMDKSGAELTGVLNQIKLAILFIFD